MVRIFDIFLSQNYTWADNSQCWIKILLQASVTLTNQSVSDKILWLTQHAMASLSKWILFANYSILQLSSGVTNSYGRLLLRTFNSIFPHFIASIQSGPDLSLRTRYPTRHRSSLFVPPLVTNVYICASGFDRKKS